MILRKHFSDKGLMSAGSANQKQTENLKLVVFHKLWFKIRPVKIYRCQEFFFMFSCQNQGQISAISQKTKSPKRFFLRLKLCCREMSAAWWIFQRFWKTSPGWWTAEAAASTMNPCTFGDHQTPSCASKKGEKNKFAHQGCWEKP